MWDRVTVPIGVSHSLDVIFSALLTGGIDRKNPSYSDIINKKEGVTKICLSRFIANFPFNIFCNEYAIFYEIIITLQVTVFTSDQLRSIIDNNRDLILDSPYIDKSKYATTASGNIASDDDIVNAITSTVIDRLNELSFNFVSEEEFKSSCITYIDWYKNAFAEFTALNMSAIMSDTGFEDRKPGKRVRKYHGINDMVEYYNDNMRIIKALSEESKTRSKVLDDKWLENEMQQENKKDNAGLFTIGIPEMDEKIGTLRRSHMIGIMGAPKGGKTRFTNYLVNRALDHGFNVCVWAAEGTAAEWEATQTACFIASTSYKQAKSGKRDSMLRISSKDILERKYNNSVTMRKEIAAAKTAIATSKKRGRLSIIEGTLYLEDMFDTLNSHYENDNPFDVLVIDQLINVMSRKGKGKVERISEAYMRTKNFIANELKRPALAIIPCQLKQEVVDFLRRNPTETIDVTAGGESAETIRTPDQTIGLFSSKEERDNNIMKFYSVASRHNGDFSDFQGRCYMECCYFLSEQDEL